MTIDLNKVAKMLKMDFSTFDANFEKDLMEILYDNNFLGRIERNKPFVFEDNQIDGRTKLRISRGNPQSYLIAFLHNNKIYIGWSKKHPTLERMPFRKEFARAIAAMRAFTDEINFLSEKTAVTKDHKKYIPCKTLYSFIARAKKYYAGKELADNITMPESPHIKLKSADQT